MRAEGSHPWVEETMTSHLYSLCQILEFLIHWLHKSGIWGWYIVHSGFLVDCALENLNKRKKNIFIHLFVYPTSLPHIDSGPPPLHPSSNLPLSGLCIVCLSLSLSKSICLLSQLLGSDWLSYWISTPLVDGNQINSPISVLLQNEKEWKKKKKQD